MINPKKSKHTPNAQCTLTNCVSHEDCVIIEITKKAPKNALCCSYFKDKDKKGKKK